MAYEFLGDDRCIAVHFAGRAGYFPFHLGCFFGSSAIDFPIEILHNFRPALIPPHRSRCYLLPVLQHQRVRQIGIRIGLRLIVVRGIWRLGILAIRSAPE